MPATEIVLDHTKTYANEATLKRTVDKALGASTFNYRYFIAWTKEGRCYPVFYNFGTEVQRAINIAMGYGWHALN